MPQSLVREPYASELDYFKKNPNVSGMATEDNKVILNPYSKLKPEEYKAVVINETARLKIKNDPSFTPTFSLTKQQEEFLNSTTYKDVDENNRKATIAARLVSGDPSAGQPTKEQEEFVNRLRQSIFNKPEMATGGQVMNQTQRLFAEGGMPDEGGTVDPVSGNQVPPGAMQEEVRDDIPAQLSEGEFIFPADVVRYIGLERLMKMRDQAKKGLKRMEEIGQMGNAEEVANPEAPLEDEQFSSTIDEIMGETENEQEYAYGGDVSFARPAMPAMPAVPTPEPFVFNESQLNNNLAGMLGISPDSQPTTMPPAEAPKMGMETPTMGMAKGGLAKRKKK